MTGLSRRKFVMGGGAALVTALCPMAASAGSKPIYQGDVAYIQVRKAIRSLDLIGRDQKILKSYRVQLGRSPHGHKRFQGDNKTPEGGYTINRKNPHSKFHLSLGVSYPNREDRGYAASRGRSPGGDIFIHGQPNGRQGTYAHDWTRGCIAVSNRDMDELFRVIRVGCPIHIFA